MNYDVLQKIEKLKQKFFNNTNEHHLATIEAWEQEVKQALVSANVAELPPIRKFLASLKATVDEFNFSLQNDRTLTVEQRNALFDRKEVYINFMALFVSAEDTMKAVEAMVDDNLSDEDKKEEPDMPKDLSTPK